MEVRLCAIDWELNALPAIRRKRSHTAPAAIIGCICRQGLCKNDATLQSASFLCAPAYSLRIGDVKNSFGVGVHPVQQFPNLELVL